MWFCLWRREEVFRVSHLGNGMTVVAKNGSKIKRTATGVFTGRNTAIIVATEERTTLRGMTRRVGTTKKRIFTISASVSGGKSPRQLVSLIVRGCNGMSVLIGGTKVLRRKLGPVS